MNTERLHAIAKAINASFAKSNSVDLLGRLVSSLQQQVSSPQQPQFQQQVSNFRAQLFQGLENDPANSFSPIYVRVVDEIGGAGLLGTKLKDHIAHIFEDNKITPATAASDLTKILDEVKKFQQVISQLSSCLATLKIGSDELDAGQSELAVLIPRQFVSSEVKRFGEELQQINMIFGVFSEVAIGSRPPLLIKTIGSSDLLLFLWVGREAAAAIARTLDWLITKYRDLLEIKKLRNDLMKTGVQEADLAAVDKRAEGLLDAAIDEWIPQLWKEFTAVTDDGRKNELSIELKISMKKIAGRIDRGFNIEVRTSEQSAAEDVDKKATDDKYIEEIHKATKSMEFVKSEGPPILKLPSQD